jgi:hypothetical protein
MEGFLMTQNRSNSGMTSAQIGILIGLGLIVVILFGFVLWFMFGGRIRLPSFSGAPENTPIPQMTSTPVVFPTLTPTATLTPVPYEQLIPTGWKQFKTKLVEIWLPPSFKTIDRKPNEELSLQGATSSDSLYRLSATVSFEPLTGGSLDAHIDDGLSKMDLQKSRLTERRKVSLNGIEAVRMVFEGRIETLDVNQLTYAIQDGDTVWFVYYTAQINEFYDMLPIFEQSVKTFRTVK